MNVVQAPVAVLAPFVDVSDGRVAGAATSLTDEAVRVEHGPERRLDEAGRGLVGAQDDRALDLKREQLESWKIVESLTRMFS